MNNYIIKNENATYWECGFSCDNHIYVKLGSESFFITDSRYEIEVKECKKIDQVIIGSDLIKELRLLLLKNQIKVIIIDPQDLSISEYTKLTKNLNKIVFKERLNFSKIKRMIKTEEEIKLIKKAMELGRKGFNDFKQNLPEYIGKTEQWMAFENKKILKKNGELDISFEPIIALEKNAAKPHATPTNKKYEEGKILLIDAGIKYKRYCSDRTETYINKKSKEQQKVYDIVLKAQEEVIKKGRSGMKASELDILARTYIDKQGFGKFFVHSTGHGVGVDIHEFPYITKNNNVIIEDNMTFSVEPGIYLPNNFGVRIEDCVSVKNGKLELL